MTVKHGQWLHLYDCSVHEVCECLCGRKCGVCVICGYTCIRFIYDKVSPSKPDDYMCVCLRPILWWPFRPLHTHLRCPHKKTSLRHPNSFWYPNPNVEISNLSTLTCPVTGMHQGQGLLPRGTTTGSRGGMKFCRWPAGATHHCSLTNGGGVNNNEPTGSIKSLHDCIATY